MSRVIGKRELESRPLAAFKIREIARRQGDAPARRHGGDGFFRRRGIRVEKELNKLTPALGSADQIRQVLSNLVVNAKDSMNQGGVLRVRTRVARKNDFSEVIRILVADSGCGISPGILRTMFEPFVTTKGERGTGLGLWIVKGIIENHGGKLKVRSRPDQGTVFSIELPSVV